MGKSFLFVCRYADSTNVQEKYIMIQGEPTIDHARNEFRNRNANPELLIISIWECRLRFPEYPVSTISTKPQYKKVDVDRVKIMGVKFWWWMLLTIPIGAGMDALFYLLWRLIF